MEVRYKRGKKKVKNPFDTNKNNNKHVPVRKRICSAVARNLRRSIHDFYWADGKLFSKTDGEIMNVFVQKQKEHLPEHSGGTSSRFSWATTV